MFSQNSASKFSNEQTCCFGCLSVRSGLVFEFIKADFASAFLFLLHRVWTLGILEIVIAIAGIYISFYCFHRVDHVNIFGLFVVGFFVLSIVIPLYGLICGVYKIQLKPTKVGGVFDISCN